MTIMTTLDIQRALNQAGASPRVDEDGIFGRKTIAAVKRFQARAGLDTDGIVGPLTLRAFAAAIGQDGAALADAAALGGIVPPWVETARRKMGLSEKRDNAELRAFLKSDGNTLGDPAKLPWCGDLIETCIALTLPEEPMVTNPYWALNWLKFGVMIPEALPRLGAIGVIIRDGGGHVFFIVGHDERYWHALGGNQSNTISIMKVAKDRTQGLRWPSTVPIPTNILSMSTFDGTISTNEA